VECGKRLTFEERAYGHDCEVGVDDDGDHLTDVEADAMTLRDAGMGTDEDYGYFGGEEY
jgi:hypothetical protein